MSFQVSKGPYTGKARNGRFNPGYGIIGHLNSPIHRLGSEKFISILYFQAQTNQMAQVHFTQALRRFFPGLGPMEVNAATVADLLRDIDKTYPGIRAYLVNDQGALRQHVNIFVNNELVEDRENLTDTLEDRAEVYIMQALSGG